VACPGSGGAAALRRGVGQGRRPAPARHLAPLPPPTSGRRGQGRRLPARRGAAGAAGWPVRAAAALRFGPGRTPPLRPPTFGRRGQGRRLPARRGAAGAAGWPVREAAAQRRAGAPAGRAAAPPPPARPTLSSLLRPARPGAAPASDVGGRVAGPGSGGGGRRGGAAAGRDAAPPPELIFCSVRNNVSVHTELQIRTYGIMFPYVRNNDSVHNSVHTGK
jgi:hypothetical protein